MGGSFHCRDSELARTDLPRRPIDSRGRIDGRNEQADGPPTIDRRTGGVIESDLIDPLRAGPGFQEEV
jgi:hypothetical protein